ncbi:tail fiber domain-containing protein [bacterium]|nr:tail fiber domain-containing protein [bacterium]
MATYTTIIRDLSGLTGLTNTSGLANAANFVLALDTTQGPNGAWRTQKISLDQIRNYVLKSTADFAGSTLTTDAKDIVIGYGTNTNVGIGGAPDSTVKLKTTGSVNITQDLTVGNVVYGNTSLDECFIGNARSATKLKTSQTIMLGGELSGQTDATNKFDGTKTVTIQGFLRDDVIKSRHLANKLTESQATTWVLPRLTVNVKGQVTNIETGSLIGDVTSVGDTTTITPNIIANSHVSNTAAIADTKLSTIQTVGKVSNSATTANANNAGETIVLRDSAGNFSASVITADLAGISTYSTRWTTPLEILYHGDITGKVQFAGNEANAKVYSNLQITTAGVDSVHLKQGAVDEHAIAAAAVSNSKIAPAAVDASSLANGAVTKSKIATGAVDGDLIDSVDKSNIIKLAALHVPNATGQLAAKAQVNKTENLLADGQRYDGTEVSNTYGNTLVLRDSSGNFEVNKITAYDDVIVAASSDINLKTDIKTLTGSLQKISKIRGTKFNWDARKDTPYEGSDYGVIAQEVEEIFPEMVVTRENGIKAVRYDRLIPVLIEAVKELSLKVHDLENK